MLVISQESHDVLQHFKNLKLVVTCGRVDFINLIFGNKVRCIQVFTGYKKYSHISFSVVHKSGTAKISLMIIIPHRWRWRRGLQDDFVHSFIQSPSIHPSIHPSNHPPTQLYICLTSSCFTISVKTNNQADIKLGWHIHSGPSLRYFRIFYILLDGW